MTEILLRELSRSDIDWMAATGQKLELAEGEVLLKPCAAIDAMYLILDGTLALILPDANNPEREISTFLSGDVIGVFFLLNDYPISFTVKAKEKTLVLAIPQQKLADKLNQDTHFSARFYRAIAKLLYKRQWRIANLLPKNAMLESLFSKTILSVFSCLNDSDICWLNTKGRVERLGSDKIFTQEGQPADTMYILLKGSLSAFVSEQVHNPLSMAFGASSASQHPPKQVNQILPGEILGFSQLLDWGPHPYTLKTNQESLVLAFPISIVLNKVQQDEGFASRLYRALASLESERTQQVLNYVGGGKEGYKAGDSLCTASNYDEELDMNTLQRMSLARARFNWMLQSQGVKA